ncbi:MAG: protein translocase subunit SecF [Candidatus Nanoarchaeia archaeon]
MNIVKYKYIYFLISGIVIIPGVIALSLWGLKAGIDFTGGVLLQLELTKAQSLQMNEIRKTLEPLKLEDLTLQSAGGNNLIIKTRPIDQQKVDEIKNVLTKKFGEIKQSRYENIGPTIGRELTKKAFWAVLLASVAIVLYIAYAFRKVPAPASSWRFGICAVLALLHDILVVTGIFSILGHLGKVEIDSYFITALLTIMGFSVHDTIVVFDRIRENLRRFMKMPFEQVINESILQTLGRSINTSMTVLLVLAALYLLGGASIKNFALALLIGIITGTYSSIFTASPLLIVWQNLIEKRKKKTEKE